MNRILSILFVFFLCLSSLSAQEALTNNQIVELTKAGLGEDVIITMVKTSQTNFSVGFPDIVALKKAGVSDTVIKAMIQAGKEVSVAPSTPLASATAPAASAMVDNSLIPDRTLVKIMATKDVSSGDVKVGDILNFEVAEDVLTNNEVVISKGTPVLCEVSTILERGRQGRGGILQIRAQSTRAVSGASIPLSGNFTDGDPSIPLVGMLSGGFGLLKKGKHAEIKKGETFNAFTGKEITISSR